MSTFNRTLKEKNGHVILPKTRSEWVYRPDNNDLENELNSLDNMIKTGLLLHCTHSKVGTVHTLDGIPTELPKLITVRFKATGDYVDGDTFSINNTTFIVRNFNNSEIGDSRFKNGGIVECDVSIIDAMVYLRAKSPNIPPYNPIDPPQFTYTGTYQTEIEAGVGYKIYFITSGIFTLLYPDSVTMDLFLVGGGGGGGSGSCYPDANVICGGGGGGGGYTKTFRSIILNVNENYTINIGSGGIGGPRVNKGTQMSDSFNGKSGGITKIANSNGSNLPKTENTNGGLGGGSGYGESIPAGNGGNGGSGGAPGYLTSQITNKNDVKGGSNGSDGVPWIPTLPDTTPSPITGIGQHTSTREFGVIDGKLNSGGGGGGGMMYAPAFYPNYSLGGAGSGGDGGSGGYLSSTGNGKDGKPGKQDPGYGNGGGGGGQSGNVGSATVYAGAGGAGQSGVLIIRNTRTSV